ncbi:LOW QUALITY PROTEIN: hypothetical protein OSB04_013385 [Centaurea solstitialis]|uniref:Uncharacterized protein n=1 Tax=Centaurea solstitialis TaxID=347529 RepID=A0AA38WR89_9ASTR|nr:LOW QUALITY PROTEIN: hypothetical protein OSB04_013385 [Centaurea solstitialis]
MRQRRSLMLYQIRIIKCYALVLIDSGVHRSYVSTTLLHYVNRKMEQLERSFIVEIVDESQREIVEIIEIIVGGKEFPSTMMPMCLGRFDVVLGVNYLSENDAQIVCDKKMIKKERRDRNYLDVDVEDNEIRINVQVELVDSIRKTQKEVQLEENVKKETIDGQVKLLTIGPDAESSLVFLLDDKLRIYVIDFGGSWDNHLLLALLCKAVKVGRQCCTDVGKRKLVGPELVHQTSDKIVQVRERLKVAYERQKNGSKGDDEDITLERNHKIQKEVQTE